MPRLVTESDHGEEDSIHRTPQTTYGSFLQLMPQPMVQPHALALMLLPPQPCGAFNPVAVCGPNAVGGVAVVPTGALVESHAPPPAQMPAFGTLHSFHPEASYAGYLSDDRRRFVKTGFHGRLTTITDSQVCTCGTHRYTVQFAGGNLSSADGVGFIFSPFLPCSKNIQNITSVFVNKKGSICFRSNSEVTRSHARISPLEVGEWIEVVVNLDDGWASFTVWSAFGQRSSADFHFGALPNVKDGHRLDRGYFGCVVKHVGVSVQFAS